MATPIVVESDHVSDLERDLIRRLSVTRFDYTAPRVERTIYFDGTLVVMGSGDHFTSEATTRSSPPRDRFFPLGACSYVYSTTYTSSEQTAVTENITDTTATTPLQIPDKMEEVN